MAPRALGCLRIAAAALVACAACGKGKDKADDKVDVAKPSAADLELRCEQLGKACGDQPKHVDKIVDDCKQAAKQQVQHGCADKAVVLAGCYERDLCGTGEKVWTLEDLRVLAERHGKCVAERDAVRACTDK